ncbi:MAG: hypothetical protein ACRDK5_01195 [Solirubrobacterales bacterium]
MSDSAFSRYFDVFTARSGSKKADQHGRFSIPGEQMLELPKGRVRIYFDTATGSPGDESGFSPPSDLSVKVVDEQTGEDVPIRHKLSFGVSSHETRKFTRTYIGRMDVPHAGAYKVSATQPSGGYPEPHLSLG